MSIIIQIRTIYTISVNTFVFIAWGFILNVIVGETVSDRLYIISLILAFVLQFLLNKLSNKRAALALSIAFAELLTFLIIGSSNFVYNSIFNVFIIIVTKTSEEDEVSYESLKLRAKQWISAIMVLGLFVTISGLSVSPNILRFYIIFLVSIIIVLREARNYFYGIKNKRTMAVNIGVAAGIMLISLEAVFTKVLSIIKFFYHYVQLFLNLIVNLITIIMKVPLEIAMNYLAKKHIQNPDLLEKVSGGKEITYDTLTSETQNLPHWLNISLETIIFIGLLFIAYKMFLRYKHSKGKKDMPLIEQREKIEPLKKKESFIKSAIKRLLKQSSLKEQIFNIYKKFQDQTFEKGIYKKHMTAKQLENVTKTYVENPEGMETLTKVYNETKFSTHGVRKEDVEAVKESYNKVKKQL